MMSIEDTHRLTVYLITSHSTVNFETSCHFVYSSLFVKHISIVSNVHK